MASQCFLCPAQPSGPLVTCGCFIWKPHPSASFIKKLCLCSWFNPSANINQQLSHTIPQAPLLVLLYFCFSVPTHPTPLLIQPRNKWMTVRDKLRQRSKEGEICSCVVEQPISVKGNPPLAQRELHLLCNEALEAFSCCDGTGPPRTIPPPLCLSPRFSPLSLFSLCHSSVSEFMLERLHNQQKILQNDKMMFVQLYSKWAVKDRPACCRKTAFCPWRIAMVTAPPAVQRALWTKQSFPMQCLSQLMKYHFQDTFYNFQMSRVCFPAKR